MSKTISATGQVRPQPAPPVVAVAISATGQVKAKEEKK